MSQLLGILFILCIVYCVLWFVVIMSHYSMTTSECRHWGWGNYTKFVREFKKHDWEKSEYYSCLSNDKEGCYLYASIIQFDGNGMVVWNLFDYILISIYIHRYIKRIYRIGKMVKW